MAGRAFLKPAPPVHHRLAPLSGYRFALSVPVWIILLSSFLFFISNTAAETTPSKISRKPTRPPSYNKGGPAKSERLLSSARQRSRVDACRLADGSFLVASEWLKGQNLRRVSLHRCVFTNKGARCSGGVDIPIPGHGFGQSHPQLVCEGLPKPIVAPTKTSKSKTSKSKKSKSKRSKSKRTEDEFKVTPKISVPANTPLLYLREGRLSRGLTQLHLYGIFIDPPPRPIDQRQSDHVRNLKSTSIRPKRVCRLALPPSVRSKDMIGRITRNRDGEIWLTAHESPSGVLPRLWLLKSRNGRTFTDAKELFAGQDGKVIPLPDGRRFMLYRKKEKPEGRPETYVRITDRNNSSWLPPVQISSNHLHLRSSSPVLYPSSKEIILFSAGQNLAVRSHTLFSLKLKIPDITRPKGAAKKTGSAQKSLHPEKKVSKNQNIRVTSIKKMLPLSKKRRLYPEFVGFPTGKRPNSPAEKIRYKTQNALKKPVILYAQELKKLRFELRALVIPNSKR